MVTEINLFLKTYADNKAIAIIGVKLSGWGIILPTIPIVIKAMIKIIFFFISGEKIN